MSYLKQWSVVVVTFVIFADLSEAMGDKRSPCPKVFVYRKDKATNEIFGKVAVHVDQIGQENRLQLNVTLVHQLSLPTPYVGSIEAMFNPLDILMNVFSKTKKIEYRIKFPTRDDYFYLKSVEFNGKIQCYRDALPYMGNMYINLSDYKIIGDVEPLSSSELPTIQNVYQRINSDIFNMPKRNTCSSSHPSQECSTTSRYNINTHTKKKPPTTPIPTTKPIDKPRPYLSTTQNYRSSSPTIAEQPKRPNPDNFVKALKQNPNENYNSLFDPAQLDVICGTAKIDPLRKWPWLSVVYKKGLTKLTVVSSGALLSDIFIITAAHPVSEFNGRPTRPEELSVRVGAFDLEDWIDKSSSPRTVREIIYHPEFQPKQIVLKNNIALLRIAPLKFNKFISPVCLIRANRNDIANEISGMAIGWGYDLTNMLNVRSSEIAMKTLPAEECRSANVAIPYFMTPTTLCARSEAVPLLCLEEPGQGFYTPRVNSDKWILAGTLSYSIKNDPEICRIAETRLFTDLTKYVSWIEEQMFRNNY